MAEDIITGYLNETTKISTIIAERDGLKIITQAAEGEVADIDTKFDRVKQIMTANQSNFDIKLAKISLIKDEILPIENPENLIKK